jgi:hypothetical protein
MKLILSVTGVIIAIALSSSFNPVRAQGYEECAVESYAHCMKCGRDYGFKAAAQQRYCTRKGFPPPGTKKKSKQS